MKVPIPAIAVSLAASLVWCPPPASAIGPAGKCVVTVRKVELKTPDGDWKTAFEGRLPLDLAGEESAVRFANGGAPAGTYVGARLTIDETIEVTGFDGIAKTLEGGEIEIRGTASDLDALPGQITALTEAKPTYTEEGKPGPIRVTLDYDYADRDDTILIASARDFTKPFRVKTGSKFAVILRADVSESISRVWPGFFDKFPDKDVMIFQFPSSFSEFSINVDYDTSSAGGKIDAKF